jgi:hypothetical protein
MKSRLAALVRQGKCRHRPLDGKYGVIMVSPRTTHRSLHRAVLMESNRFLPTLFDQLTQFSTLAI